MTKITRRKFFSGLTTGAAGLLLGGCGQPDLPNVSGVDNKIRQYNQLGKTGIRTSDIVFGAGDINTPGVVRYAYDLGVNLFDTSERYMGGVSEEILGEGLKGVRHKAHIITKFVFQRGSPITRESVAKKLEVSLRKMQTDYVDFLFVFLKQDMELLKNDEIRSAFSRFKKEGKIRFSGFSTHNERLTLRECMKPEYDDFVDAVLFFYNHLEGTPLEPLVAEVRRKGIGTIAMKILAGGKQGNLKEFTNERLTYPQAALSWVLANKNIDCAAVSMDSFSLVDTFIAASGKRLDRSDLALLKKYREAVDAGYCRMSCTACESYCPHSVAISDIMRYTMYYEDYGQQKRAMSHYSALETGYKPVNCSECSGTCIQVEMVNCNTCIMVNRNTSVKVNRNAIVLVTGIA